MGKISPGKSPGKLGIRQIISLRHSWGSDKAEPENEKQQPGQQPRRIESEKQIGAGWAAKLPAPKA